MSIYPLINTTTELNDDFTPELKTLFNELKPLIPDLKVAQGLIPDGYYDDIGTCDLDCRLDHRHHFKGPCGYRGPEELPKLWKSDLLCYRLSFITDKNFDNKEIFNIKPAGSQYDNGVYKVFDVTALTERVEDYKMGLYLHPGAQKYVEALNERYSDKTFTMWEALQYKIDYENNDDLFFNGQLYNSIWCYTKKCDDDENRVIEAGTVQEYKYVPIGKYEYHIKLHHVDFEKNGTKLINCIKQLFA